MKRYIKTAYVISFAALAFAGCSKTDEFQTNPDSALQIESVSGISTFALMQEPTSKAVITGKTLPGDEAAKGIGLFVTASDGTAYDLHNYNGRPHPRNAGHSTRFLRLVREHDLMPIEDAVYKLTGLPAAVMGMEERFGFLKEGLDANVTIFDKDTVTDHATYEEPAQASEGIDYVIVNGEVVLDHDVITDARPGKCILG